MAWGRWIREHRFTLYKTALIQKSLIELIQREFPEGASLLETGCGSGTTLVLLDDMPYDVWGADNDPTVVKACWDLYPHLRDRVREADLTLSDCYSRQYDSIYHQGVLEHFDEGEIVRILRLQAEHCAKVIFDVPNSRRLNKSDEGDHTRFESPGFWHHLIREVGLEFRTYARNIDFINEWMPEALKRLDSPLVRLVGRSSMFVCWNPQE